MATVECSICGERMDWPDDQLGYLDLPRCGHNEKKGGWGYAVMLPVQEESHAG